MLVKDNDVATPSKYHSQSSIVAASAPVVAFVVPSPDVTAREEVTVCNPKNVNEAAIGRIAKAFTLLFMLFNPFLGFSPRKRHYVFGASSDWVKNRSLCVSQALPRRVTPNTH